MNGQEEVGARRAPSTLITTFISFTAPTCKFSGTIRRLHFHSYLHTASTLFTKTAPLHQHGGIFTHLNLFSVWTQFKIQSRGFSDQCFIVSEDISAFAHGHTVRLDHQSDLCSFHERVLLVFRPAGTHTVSDVLILRTELHISALFPPSNFCEFELFWG